MNRSLILSTVLMMGLSAAVAVGQTSAPAGAASQPAGPASQPAQAVGKLAIRAVQGTQGGPKIGAEKVTVELRRHGKPPEQIEALLDEHGVVILENLSVAEPFIPRVTVRYGEVGWHAGGKEMSAAAPEQQVTVKVYETTEQRPAWEVEMRHVFLNPTDHGLHVTDAMTVHNPADRLWLGTRGAMGLNTTLAMALPPGAREIKLLQGFSRETTAVIGSRLVHTGPLGPGSTRFRLAYTIPPQSGHARVVVTAPAPTKRLAVFAPGSDPDLHSNDLQKGGIFESKGGPMRTYQSINMPAGGRAAFTYGMVPHGTASHEEADPDKDDSLHSAQWLAGVGGGGFLVLCPVVLILGAFRKNKPPAAPA